MQSCKMMDLDSALEFLHNHQPLPADDQITEEQLLILDDVRKYFLKNYAPEAIPLLLNVFGDGNGFGVYQLMEDIFENVPKSTLVPCIAEGLRSKHRGVRYWNAEIASRYPAQDLIEPLSELLQDADVDIRTAASLALIASEQSQAKSIFRAHLIRETDPELCEIIVKHLKT